ncbi:hypothetical protein DXG01_000128 [Tephrocybe rancida]|nr:hypothetical protein DXG01_000128 [Tephrocybe rancida]
MRATLTIVASFTAFLASPTGNRLLHSHITRGDVVEIQGGPSSGKTHLLYHLVIDCITPTLHGGWAKAAIVFDMDHSFDIVRLNHLLLHRLTRLTGLNALTVASISQSALRKLHIFRPASTAQLAATLSHLAAYHSISLAEEEIGVVAIDSMSSHYWPDRFIVEQMKIPSTQPGLNHVSPLQNVLLALKSFARSHQALVLMTNWGLHSFNNSSPSQYRQHLHPFPTITPGSHLPQQGQTSDPALYPRLEHMLSLTCHITLQSDFPESHDRDGDVQQVQIKVGLVRKPDSSSATKFVLYISSEDASIE